MIGDEFGRKKYGWVPVTAIERVLEPLECQNYPPNQINPVVKVKQ
jgi:hypothetical protein